MEKFEYCIFSAHEGYINQRLPEYEKEGWEVAGDAHVKYHDSPTSAAFIYIPMKRKIYSEVPERVTIVSECSQFYNHTGK